MSAEDAVRAYLDDQRAEQLAAERDRVFAALHRLSIAVLVSVVAGIAGGCTAWLVLR